MTICLLLTICIDCALSFDEIHMSLYECIIHHLQYKRHSTIGLGYRDGECYLFYVCLPCAALPYPSLPPWHFPFLICSFYLHLSLPNSLPSTALPLCRPRGNICTIKYTLIVLKVRQFCLSSSIFDRPGGDLSDSLKYCLKLTESEYSDGSLS